MFVKEVPACIKLHLIQLAYESEVNHGTHLLTGDYLRVAAYCIDGLKLAESRAHC